MEIICTLSHPSQIESLKQVHVTSMIIGVAPFSSAVSTCFDDMDEIVKKIKEHGCKAIIDCNRPFYELELNALTDFLTHCKEIDVDEIIFNDLAVFEIAAELDLVNRLVYDPNTLAVNSRDIDAMLQMGVKSVMISDEITLEETCYIAQQVQGNVEVLLHGRGLMSVSRRPLLQNYMAEINNDEPVLNRHDLRLIEATRTGQMPVVEDNNGTWIFSENTLCSYEELNQLMQAGITRFRVHGTFIPFEALCHQLQGYARVLSGENPIQITEEMKTMYPEANFSSGYYYKKTNLTK